jgi:predicted DNA-binding protein
MSSRAGDQFMMRMPPGMRARLQREADKNRRPLAAEVIDAIRKHLDSPTILEHLDERLRRVEDMVTRHQGQLVTTSHLILALGKENGGRNAR